MQKIQINKKAQMTLGDIPGIAKAIGVGIIFVAVFALILINVFNSVPASSVGNGVCNTSPGAASPNNCTLTQNVILNGTSGLSNLSNQFPLIALIAAFVIVIGVVLFLTRERT